LSGYFPQEAFQLIDIFDFDHTVKIIDSLIATDVYEQRKDILAACKQKVLSEYNMFDYVASLCDRLDPSAPKKQLTLRPCRPLQDWRNFYNYTIARNHFKWKQKLKALSGSPSPLIG
jgi:hypothetical protein